MNFFEKFKLWTLTPENKQKYLMEKEKEERKKNREKGLPLNPEAPGKDKNKDKKVKKSKKGRKGKNNIVEEIPVVKKKIIKKVVRRKEDSEETEDLKSKLESIEKEFSDKDKEKEKLDSKDDLNLLERKDHDISKDQNDSSINDKDLNGDSVSEVSEVAEVLESDHTESDNTESDNTEFIAESVSEDTEDVKVEPKVELPLDLKGKESIELRNEELVKKKLEEKDRYLDIRLSFPPTDSIDKIIQWSLEAGIPEWYLREEGIVVDEGEIQEKVSNLEVGLDLIKAEEAAVARQEQIQMKYKLLVEEQEIERGVRSLSGLSNDEDVVLVNDKPRVDEVEFQEDIIIEGESEDSGNKEIILGDEPFEIDNDESAERSEEVLIEDTIDLSEDLNDDDKELPSRESIDLGTDADVYADDPEESHTPIIVPEKDIEVESDTTDRNDVVLNGESTKSDNLELNSTVKESVSLEDRLKSIAKHRTKSVALNVNGGTVFVKEEKEDDFGNKKTNYKNYKVDQEDLKDVVIGEVIKEGIIKEVVEPKTIIDGEEYNISSDEEKRIIRDKIRREVWIITNNSTWIENLNVTLKDTRYVFFQVSNERDFLLATRSIDNTIVITQKIPGGVKSSISSYLKYLDEEQRRARLVTVEDSPVKARIIEHIFTDITEEELDSYYNSYDSSLYSKSMKSDMDVLKVISFDLTDVLNDSIDLDESIYENYEDDEYVEESNGGIYIDLDLDLDVDLEEDIADRLDLNLDNVLDKSSVKSNIRTEGE